ncbi:hypothetical protein [Halomicrobium urmianum]|uniref:hypothetical protein n=1 Tax=Halomicrobium urmianum TaxID=1586233 RepID=UPI001CD998B0|nr:hypothetical protein [Halomicrobium urmianum]
MIDLSKRQLLALLLTGLFVLGAGCTGLGGSGSGSNATNTTSLTEGTDTEAVESAEETTERSSESADEQNSSDGDDGHDHDHGGNSSATTENTDNASEGGATDGAIAGKMTVVVAADELSLPARDEDGDGFGMADDPHTWTTRSNVTLAEALARFDVTADVGSLSVDGTTYQSSTEGTTVSYRVNGEPVDPTEVALEDGDQVWVTVETDEMDAAVPGTYIDNQQQHVHGHMNVTVAGEELDFSRSKYQSNDRYFHFENGEGEYWHAHSSNVTLDYALDSLSGINASGETVTVDGTTYDGGDADTTVTVEVDGESVSPSEYFLKDGDDVSITIERTGN